MKEKILIEICKKYNINSLDVEQKKIIENKLENIFSSLSLIEKLQGDILSDDQKIKNFANMIEDYLKDKHG
jgi:hypothetical protein